MGEIIGLPFFQNALIAGGLLAVLMGVIGPLVVVNRMVFMAGGIAHAVYGGIGAAVFFHFSILVGAVAAAIVAALLILLLTLQKQYKLDSAIGVIWAVGMAIGVVLSDLAPGYHVNLMTFLFGSILAVSPVDLWWMAGADLLFTLLIGIYFFDWQALSFDPLYAGLRGVKVLWLKLLLLCMVALTVVIAMRLVGLILVIALLTIPVYCSTLFARSLAMMMVGSLAASLIFIGLGLVTSFWFNVSSGATIVLVAGVASALFWVFKTIINKLFQRSSP